VALGIMLVGLGVRADLMTARALIFLLLKARIYDRDRWRGIDLSDTAGTPRRRAKNPVNFGRDTVRGDRSACRNQPRTRASSHWDKMVMGEEWLECLLSIPIIAIVPFAAIIAAVRRAAPTNLVRTGAFAGLISGGVSAMAYALHCTDDSLPFVAVWYGGTIVLCTLAGAILGPRLLRW